MKTKPDPNSDPALERSLVQTLVQCEAEAGRLARGEIVGGIARMGQAAKVQKLAADALTAAKAVLKIPKSGVTSKALGVLASRALHNPASVSPEEIKQLAGSVLSQVADYERK